MLGEADELMSKDCYLVKEIEDWSSYLREKEEAVTIEQIRKDTRTGRPCGDETFGKKIEEIVGRRLVALPHGRPKKKQ